MLTIQYDTILGSITGDCEQWYLSIWIDEIFHISIWFVFPNRDAQFESRIVTSLVKTSNNNNTGLGRIR